MAPRDDDTRRVRPLPPAGDDPRAARPGPASAFAAALVILAVVGVAALVFWPDGEPTSEVPALPPATVPATLGDTTTSTSRLTTTTVTTAPAEAPQAFGAETAFGPMAWRLQKLSSATQLVTNPVYDGEEFAYVSGQQQLLVHRSVDGISWTPSATGIDGSTVDEVTALASVGGDLVLGGFGFGRPRVWRADGSGPWLELDLPRPEPVTAGPFSVFWDRARPVPSIASDLVVWGGAWVAIDWKQILGDFSAFTFDSDPDERLVTVAGDDEEPRTYEVTFQASGDAVHVLATDVATGDAAYDSVVAAGGFDPAILAATLSQLDPDWRWQPAVWVGSEGRPLRFVEPGFGSFSSAMSGVAAGDSGIVATATSRDEPVTGVRPVAQSRDGVDWDLVSTEQFGENINMTGLATDGSVMLLVGSAWNTVRLAEDVTAFRSVPAAWSSPSGREWAADAVFFPGGRFDVVGVAGGPVGYVVVELNCSLGCRYDAWLSPDRTEWSMVELNFSSEIVTVTGAAMSSDTVVVIGATEDESGAFTNVRAWVGVVE